MDDSYFGKDIVKPLDTKLPLREMEKNESSSLPLDSPVKSTAVVKYSAVHCPATFAQLQCNTDLNLPPSNWLTSSAESYGLHHVSAHSSGFSSFRLAHLFPDCVGQVDVVSDAENIKKLLKIPYSRGAVSMMVHRVENTLLIDEFDIHKLLLHQSKTDWEWLREFFLTNVLQSMSIKDKGLLRSHRRAALQSRLLVSKFLHHSLVAENPPPPPPLLEPEIKLPISTEPLLPEPKGSEELPDPGMKHDFLRNVVWTFENIQMLIGTDMPIFGGSTHPCISLKLCDMAKPISVLTGIDYWLDNLMSNVPEVVMCFHLAGIVQRYELVKTEDLPHLNGSRFSPKVIRDVAQHILSFLKTNVAKAGHTYWLFKGKDEDVVKLYDLTSLCCGSIDQRGQNPFTVPVAMLLYRVARNMKQSSDSRQQHGTIHMLLDKCVHLLDAEKYPQITTSAHYMLADLYIPSTLDPADPVFDDEKGDVKSKKECKTTKRGRTSSLSKSSRHSSVSGQRPRRNSYDGFLNIPSSDTEAEVSDASENGENRNDVTLREVKSLDLSNMHVDPSSSTEDTDQGGLAKTFPSTIGVQERCKSALKHIAVGLQCLQFFEQPEKGKEDSKERNCKNEKIDEPQMAKPFEPIPMPYYHLESDLKIKGNNSSFTNVSDTSGTEFTLGKKNKHVKNSTLIESKKKSEERHVPSSSTEKNGIKRFLCPSLPGCMPAWQTPDFDDNEFWNAHLKILLYEKTCLVYATLAEQSYSSEKYGLSLHMISRVLRCRQVLDRLMGSGPGVCPNMGLASYLLGRAGDCCFMLVQRWASVDQHRHDLVSNTGVEAEIEHEMFRDCPEMDGADLSLVPEKIESIEQMLLASLRCYDRARSLDPKQDNLYRRIGNVHNELGVLYMGQAAERYQHLVQLQASKKESNDEEASRSFKRLFSKSLEHLEAGVTAFEVVADAANLALLHSNTGRLLRLCAHFYEPISNNVKDQEKRFYNKALASYQKALAILGNRKSNPAVWDTVTWELSTALYNLAVLSQDFPGSNSKCPEDAERVAVDLLQRALKYCDLETPGPRQPVYQFRAASIHHRLGSLYHQSYRSLQGSEESRHAKGVLQSCRLHYEKASEMFSLLENFVGYITVQLERVALTELQAQNASNVPAKLRALHCALDILLAARPMLTCVALRQPSSERSAHGASSASAEKGSDGDDEKEELKLLNLFEQRLHMILLTATKLSSTSGKKDLECAKALYKNMYSVCLHAPGTLKTEARNNVSALAQHLLSVISQLEPFMKDKLRTGK